MRKKSNQDYELNGDQYDKFCYIAQYCESLSNDSVCQIIRVMTEPKYEQGYIQLLFTRELEVGNARDDLTKLIDVLRVCDGINITVSPITEESFQVTFFVDNLWIKKPVI